MGLFGGGDDKASREMINLQKKEAAAARKKEEERQARIAAGLKKIKYAFHGGAPITKKVAGTFDWSKNFKPPKGTGSTAGDIGAAVASVFGPNPISATAAKYGANTPAAAVTGLPKGYTYVSVADPNYKPSKPGKPGVTAKKTTGGGTQFGGQPLGAQSGHGVVTGQVSGGLNPAYSPSSNSGGGYQYSGGAT